MKLFVVYIILECSNILLYHYYIVSQGYKTSCFIVHNQNIIALCIYKWDADKGRDKRTIIRKHHFNIENTKFILQQHKFKTLFHHFVKQKKQERKFCINIKDKLMFDNSDLNSVRRCKQNLMTKQKYR